MKEATFRTHEVFNQSPPFWDVDLFTADRPLVEAVAAYGGASAQTELSEFGRHWGSAAMAARGRIANENTPKLKAFDSRGNRRDEVEFHPAYHELMAHAAHAGLHNSTWDAQGKPAGGAAEVLRAAKYYVAAQVETGHLCPITMTRASVAALASQPDILAQTMPVIAARAYDPSFAPWWTKLGMTLGMGMTEKQGGTDVRANMTRAVRDGDAYLITGHKWFMSAPMCDAFLVLMQAVLSDMALHVEASVALVMRLCRAFDRMPYDANEAAYMRLLTPAIKYWICKSAPSFLYEAMECLGGNGYVEEGILARHYREAPVNAIWEGSGNVMCLDVLRALSREPEVASSIVHELTGETLGLPGAGEAITFLGKAFRRRDSERVARLAVERLALLAAAAALNAVSPQHAHLFAATRLAGNHAGMYGAVDLASEDVRGLLERALP